MNITLNDFKQDDFVVFTVNKRQHASSLDGFMFTAKAKDELERFYFPYIVKNIEAQLQPQMMSDNPLEALTSATDKPMHELYPAYYRDVSKLDSIDVYRAIDLFNVTDGNAQHALKKLLLSGDRTGGKSMREDFKEARDTLTRRLDMWNEDDTV